MRFLRLSDAVEGLPCRIRVDLIAYVGCGRSDDRGAITAVILATGQTFIVK